MPDPNDSQNPTAQGYNIVKGAGYVPSTLDRIIQALSGAMPRSPKAQAPVSNVPKQTELIDGIPVGQSISPGFSQAQMDHHNKTVDNQMPGAWPMNAPGSDIELPSMRGLKSQR